MISVVCLFAQIVAATATTEHGDRRRAHPSRDTPGLRGGWWVPGFATVRLRVRCGIRRTAYTTRFRVLVGCGEYASGCGRRYRERTGRRGGHGHSHHHRLQSDRLRHREGWQWHVRPVADQRLERQGWQDDNDDRGTPPVDFHYHHHHNHPGRGRMQFREQRLVYNSIVEI